VVEDGARRLLDVSSSSLLEVAAKRGKSNLGIYCIRDTHVSTLLFKPIEANSNTRVVLECVLSSSYTQAKRVKIIRIWKMYIT